MSTVTIPAPRSRGRSALTGIVGILAVVAILLATVAGTVHSVVLTPDTLASVVAPVGANPQVQAVVADKAATKIVTELDVEGRARNLLPGVTGPLLAPSIARGVHDRLATAIEDALASPAFERRWNQAVTGAATVAVRVLKGGSTAITTSDGVIYLNLLPAIGGTLDALKAQGIIDASIQLPDLTDPQTPAQAVIARLATALGVSLPPDFGQIAVAQTAALEKAQGLVSTFDSLTFVLIIVAVLLTGAAIVLADDRRAMVIRIGVAAAFLIALLPPLLRVADHAVSTAVTAPGMSVVTGAFIDAVLDAVSWPLRVVAMLCLAAALLAMLAGVLSGDRQQRTASLLPIAIGAAAFAVAWVVIGPDAALLALALITTAAWITGRPLLAPAPAQAPA